MDDIVAFLRARFDEDEFRYQGITKDAELWADSADLNEIHICAEAQRMLTEIAAKRIILQNLDHIIRALLETYRDHPDYRWPQG